MHQQPSQQQMNGNHKIKGVVGIKTETKSADPGMTISQHFQTSQEHKEDQLWADPICVTGTDSIVSIYLGTEAASSPLCSGYVLCKF